MIFYCNLWKKQIINFPIAQTVDFTSDGTPVGVAAGNLWLVRLATFILQPMEHTNHKFPAATPTGVPCEVKSTVLLSISIRFESSGAGFRLRTVDCTSRIPAPSGGFHCTEPESSTGRFEANGNRQ